MTLALDRVAGTCTACGLPKDLHFERANGSGAFLGCRGAWAVRTYLSGHGLPPPAQPPTPTGQSRSDRAPQTVR